MRQLFSSYPDGLAGLGLLALRGSAASLLVLTLQGSRDTSSWLAGAIVVVMFALILGVGTRPAAALYAVLDATILVASKCVPTTLVVGQGLGLVALLLLGPGALSIDARLFGRRKISLTR